MWLIFGTYYIEPSVAFRSFKIIEEMNSNHLNHLAVGSFESIGWRRRKRENKPTENHLEIEKQWIKIFININFGSLVWFGVQAVVEKQSARQLKRSSIKMLFIIIILWWFWDLMKRILFKFKYWNLVITRNDAGRMGTPSLSASH